jgi:cytoskeletal protein CcmA (bactofilin family)
MLRKLAKGSQGGTTGRTNLPMSIIGADVRIVGNIITQGEMQIDGQVEGDIDCARLVLGETARITGEVTADTVRVHGRLEGRIIANSVTIARSAEVVGDITHDTLEIEAGGRLEGHLIRKGSQPATVTPQLAPPQAVPEAETAEAAQ